MKRKLTAHYIILTIIALAIIIPIIWILFISLKTNESLFIKPLAWPEKLHFENYLDTWKLLNLGQHFLNTFFVSVVALIINLTVSSVLAYLITCYKFKSKVKKVIYLYFIAGLAIPPYTALYPLFMGAQKLHIYNSLWTLSFIYAGWFLPVSMLIFVGFMKNIMRELIEAAAIDGCGFFGTFIRIVLPISKPAILTVAILNFIIHYWNEYILSNTLIADLAKKSINAALASQIGDFTIRYVTISSGIIIVLIPEIILLLFLQKYIISGLTMGAVKG